MLAIGIFVTIFVTFILTPVKNAIYAEDLYKYPNSVLVMEAWHTGTGWEQVGDSNGYYNQVNIDDVQLTGNTPPAIGIGGDFVNTFLCQVEFTGFFKVRGDMQYKEYKVLDLYPMYPVKRNSLLPSWFYPKGFISKWDMKVFF